MSINTFCSLEGFFSHGTALCNVIRCDFSETIDEIERFTFEDIYEHIRDFNIEYYHNIFMLEKNRKNKKIKEDILLKYCSLTSRDTFKNWFKHYIENEKISIINSFKLAYKKAKEELDNENYIKELNTQYLEYYNNQVSKYQELIVIDLERVIMREKIRKIDKKHVIFFKEFKHTHVYELTKNIVGVIANTFMNQHEIEYRYVSVFDIPFIKSSYDFKDGDYVGINTYEDFMIINPDPSKKIRFIREYISTVKKNLKNIPSID